MADALGCAKYCAVCGREFSAPRQDAKVCGIRCREERNRREEARRGRLRRAKKKARRELEAKPSAADASDHRRRKRTRRPGLFHLVPDVPVDNVEIGNPEMHELAQAVIYSRAALIRETWSENKQQKRNNYFAEPVEIEQFSDDLHPDGYARRNAREFEG